MNKLNKTLLGIGTMVVSIAPVATVISCGNQNIGRYEADDDKLIKILTDYDDRTGHDLAYQALKKQVGAYNALTSTERKGYKVELVHQYPLPPSLATTYESQDKNKIVNMAITYPDTLGLVSKYDQQLDLSKTTPKVDLKSIFASKFTDVNDKIGGLATGGTYAVPITKSTNMMAINDSVLGYIFTAIPSLKGTSNTTKINRIIAKYKAPATTTLPQSEKDAIKSTFGTPAPNFQSTIKFDDSMFEDTTKLLDFVIVASKALKAKVYDNSNSAKKVFILGFDSSASLFYNSLNSLMGADPAKFGFRKNGEYIKYHFNDPVIKKAMTKIYNKIKEALESGGLFFGGKVDGHKEYGSQFLKSNKMAISIGSSAGYSHLAEKNTTPSKLNYAELSLEKSTSVFDAAASTTKSALVQGPSLIGLHVNATEDNATARFINWFLKEENSTSPLKTFTEKAGYIAPTKKILAASSTNLNPGAKIAFETLKEIQTGNINGFENPIDDTTGKMRVTLEEAIHEQYKQRSNGNAVQSIDKIYEYIKNNFGEFE